MNAHIMLPFPHGSTTTQSKSSDIILLMHCLYLIWKYSIVSSTIPKLFLWLVWGPIWEKVQKYKESWIVVTCPYENGHLQFFVEVLMNPEPNIGILTIKLIPIKNYQLLKIGIQLELVVFRNERASFSRNRKSNCCWVKNETNDWRRYDSQWIAQNIWSMFVCFTNPSQVFTDVYLLHS